MNTIEKLRSFRVGPFAVFDFAATYIAAWYLAPRLDWYLRREQVMWLAVPTGIVIHKLFKIDTPLNRMVLGPETNRIAQVVVALMLVKGLVKFD
jgi:hypothetical protein